MSELFLYLVGGVALAFVCMVLCFGPSPWWVKRPRSYNWTGEVHVGGDWPYIRCWHCNEWVPRDTGEHGVVKTHSLEELLAEHRKPCPKEGL